jgi:hypothetical protein
VVGDFRTKGNRCEIAKYEANGRSTLANPDKGEIQEPVKSLCLHGADDVLDSSDDCGIMLEWLTDAKHRHHGVLTRHRGTDQREVRDISLDDVEARLSGQRCWPTHEGVYRMFARKRLACKLTAGPARRSENK